MSKRDLIHSKTEAVQDIITLSQEKDKHLKDIERLERTVQEGKNF